MKKAIIFAIAIILSATACAQNAKIIGKSITITKKVSGAVLQDGRYLGFHETTASIGEIEHKCYGEAGNITVLRLEINGAQCERVIAEDAEVIMVTKNGNKCYLVTDGTFCYGSLMEVDGEWVLVLKMTEKW